MILKEEILNDIIDKTIDFAKKTEENYLSVDPEILGRSEKLDETMTKNLKDISDEIWHDEETILGMYGVDGYLEESTDNISQISKNYALSIFNENDSASVKWINEKFNELDDSIKAEFKDFVEDLDNDMEKSCLSLEEYEVKKLEYQIDTLIYETDYFFNTKELKGCSSMEELIEDNKKRNWELNGSIWTYGVNLLLKEINKKLTEKFNNSFKNLNLGEVEFDVNWSGSPTYKSYYETKGDTMIYRESYPSWNKEFVLDVFLNYIDLDGFKRNENYIFEYWNRSQVGISHDLHFDKNVFINLIDFLDEEVYKRLEDALLDEIENN